MRPLNTKGPTICTVASKHQDKSISPTGKVPSNLKLVCSILKHLNPSITIKALYDDVDEPGVIVTASINKLQDFPKELLDLDEHTLVSNSWSLVSVFGTGRNGKSKKQNGTYIYIKVKIKFCLEHLSAYMQGKLTKKGCAF